MGQESIDQNFIYQNLIQIGRVKPINNVFLAPMAGITDKTFRQICRESGCGLAYTEMVSAKSIIYGNNVKTLLDASVGEQNTDPLAVQLFGREPDIMAEAARRIMHADIIDINMGCPASKIVKNGEGSALMKEPILAGKIIQAIARAVDVPVTVKIRKGFSSESANAVEIAKIAQESGASAITVHGRTREQFYSGYADWDSIAAVKLAVKIPVIANGDVVSKETALAILSHTKCDALMIGRAACGNPWLFEQILTGAPAPSQSKKIKTALRHARMLIEHKGEHIGVLEMRKHMSWYIKGMHGATAMRTQINKATTYSDLEEAIS